MRTLILAFGVTLACTNHTHAESVQITYDPRQISYGRLLQIFFSVHDPTELNYQGPDFGSQYRSAIFPTNAEQADVALHEELGLPRAGRRLDDEGAARVEGGFAGDGVGDGH